MQSEVHVTWPLPVAELRPALELALAVAHAEMGVLMLHDDSVATLFPALGEGLSEDQCALIGAQPVGDGPFGRAMAEHQRVAIRDAWRDPNGLMRLAQRLGFRGIEILPLFGAGGQPIGAIAVMFKRVRGSNGRAARLMNCCAQLVVCAVRQARLRVAAEQARENAEKAGHANTQFLARMSHELRTPLQSIAGYIDLLGTEGAERLTPSQTHMLQRMHDSEQVLVHVIDDLITFSRLEAGRMTFHSDVVLAQEALRVAEAVVSPLAIDHGVRIVVGECPHGLMVRADGDKLNQVLVNLTANAVKFTNRGGSIGLSCRVEDDVVYFDVADTGAGIPANKLIDIFEPYVQLDTPLLDRLGGSGLGLAISREFATGMRGELTVSSKVGSGSVFTLRLPRVGSDGVRPELASAVEIRP
jgi:signal transduction histidine kinase